MAQRDQDRYRKDMSSYKPTNGQTIGPIAIPMTDTALALNSSSEEESESDSNN
jgi:hypothetical protein